MFWKKKQICHVIVTGKDVDGERLEEVKRKLEINKQVHWIITTEEIKITII